jgi:hypothetical protein
MYKLHTKILNGSYILVPFKKIRTHISSARLHPPPPLYLPYLPDGKKAQASEIAAKISAGKRSLSVIHVVQPEFF